MVSLTLTTSTTRNHYLHLHQGVRAGSTITFTLTLTDLADPLQFILHHLLHHMTANLVNWLVLLGEIFLCSYKALFNYFCVANFVENSVTAQ